MRWVSAWAIPLLTALAAACEPALDVRQVDIAANADCELVADRQINVLSGNEVDNIERDYGDGELDTKCALAAYRGDVWLTWVERDPQTRQHRNIEDRKVVEKATSGVKQTMQTQV